MNAAELSNPASVGQTHVIASPVMSSSTLTQTHSLVNFCRHLTLTAALYPYTLTFVDNHPQPLMSTTVDDNSLESVKGLESCVSEAGHLLHTSSSCLVFVVIVIFASDHFNFYKWTRHSTSSLHQVACTDNLQKPVHFTYMRTSQLLPSNLMTFRNLQLKKIKLY